MLRLSWLYILRLIRRPLLLALPPQTDWREREREMPMIDIIITIINMPTNNTTSSTSSIYMTRHSSLTLNTLMRVTMAFPQRRSAPNESPRECFLLVLRF